MYTCDTCSNNFEDPMKSYEDVIGKIVNEKHPEFSLDNFIKAPLSWVCCPECKSEYITDDDE